MATRPATTRARGRIAHLTAYFGRDARAAAVTTYQIRDPFLFDAYVRNSGEIGLPGIFFGSSQRSV